MAEQERVPRGAEEKTNVRGHELKIEIGHVCKGGRDEALAGVRRRPGGRRKS